MDGPTSIEILARVAAQNGRARPRHRCFTETALDTIQPARWLRAPRLRPRCFGSIRCSIRFAPIRVSKNSARKSSRELCDFFG